jgi:hypothetical protein
MYEKTHRVVDVDVEKMSVVPAFFRLDVNGDGYDLAETVYRFVNREGEGAVSNRRPAVLIQRYTVVSDTNVSWNCWRWSTIFERLTPLKKRSRETRMALAVCFIFPKPVLAMNFLPQRLQK